jgi:hypothetical protein
MDRHGNFFHLDEIERETLQESNQPIPFLLLPRIWALAKVSLNRAACLDETEPVEPSRVQRLQKIIATNMFEVSDEEIAGFVRELAAEDELGDNGPDLAK